MEAEATSKLTEIAQLAPLIVIFFLGNAPPLGMM
jgi:hypothetical protein